MSGVGRRIGALSKKKIAGGGGEDERYHRVESRNIL